MRARRLHAGGAGGATMMTGSCVLLRLVCSAMLLSTACTTEAKKEVAKPTIKTLGPEERRESFEAMARVLDEEPPLVDELYAVVRQHRPTMHRFLTNASRDLKEPWLADMTAGLLVQHPDALEQTLVSTMNAIPKEPKARAAMNRSMATQAAKAVDILTDDPNTLSRVLEASLTTIEKKPRARENVLAAVRLQRRQLIAFVKSDPELSKELTEELVRELVADKPALEKLLRAAGAIDEEPPAKGKAKRKR